MIDMFRQIVRLFLDDGRDDKDFSKQEFELRAAKRNLDDAIDRYQKAAQDHIDMLLKI